VRKYRAKDCADLVTSIRALGVLQPLLVRPNCEGFDVVAGQRRLSACRQLAAETEDEQGIDTVPCLVMHKGDDAAAIEASLAENIDRLPMDEIDQYKAFGKLIKEGRSAEDIAATFGLTERLVHQRLALGQLYGPILTSYRKGDLHARDIRILTMASPKQQRAWWKLVKDGEAYVPTGKHLKAWLFGGAHIPVDHARFDVEASGLAIVSDLFGDEACFADAEAFWPLQNAAIAALADAYLADGWEQVDVKEIGHRVYPWELVSAAREDGGKVFITCTEQGEVACHEGYITQGEHRARQKKDSGQATEKPELTKPLANYIALHRHAAVRADILANPAIGQRLIVAHMLCGSSLWDVAADPQSAAKPDIADSLAANKAQVAFETERAKIVALLGIDPTDSLARQRHSYRGGLDIKSHFAKLLAMSDETITRILTFLMAETLSCASPLIDDLGTQMRTELQKSWRPDQTFLDLCRDKEAINAMVGEIAGDAAAKANCTATAKAQKAVIQACLDGSRTSATLNWHPRYMRFPIAGYTNRPLA